MTINWSTGISGGSTSNNSKEPDCICITFERNIDESTVLGNISIFKELHIFTNRNWSKAFILGVLMQMKKEVLRRFNITPSLNKFFRRTIILIFSESIWSRIYINLLSLCSKFLEFLVLVAVLSNARCFSCLIKSLAYQLCLNDLGIIAHFRNWTWFSANLVPKHGSPEHLLNHLAPTLHQNTTRYQTKVSVQMSNNKFNDQIYIDKSTF
jgi:hypothetical protein